MLRRGCEALRGEAPQPAPPWGPVRAEAPPPPPPSLSPATRFPAGGRREPCRSGSGAARCALTAAGRVSRTSRARSLHLSWPGLLSRGRPLGPGGSQLSSSARYVWGRDEEESRRPWGGTVPGLSEPERAGGRRPPVPSFPLVPSVPGRAVKRRGPARFPNRKGLGQSTGRPVTEVKSERPPGCGPQRLQVSAPSPQLPRLPTPGGGPGALPGVGDIRRFPPLRLARGPPWMSSPLLTSLLPLHRGESPGCRRLANATGT